MSQGGDDRVATHQRHPQIPVGQRTDWLPCLGCAGQVEFAEPGGLIQHHPAIRQAERHIRVTAAPPSGFPLSPQWS